MTHNEKACKALQAILQECEKAIPGYGIEPGSERELGQMELAWDLLQLARAHGVPTEGHQPHVWLHGARVREAIRKSLPTTKAPTVRRQVCTEIAKTLGLIV